jgi:cytochrome b561
VKSTNRALAFYLLVIRVIIVGVIVVAVAVRATSFLSLMCIPRTTPTENCITEGATQFGSLATLFASMPGKITLV